MLGTHSLSRCRALVPSASSLSKAVGLAPPSKTSSIVCRAISPPFSPSSSSPFSYTITEHTQILESGRHSEDYVSQDAFLAIGQSPIPSTFANLLRTCMENSDLLHGRLTHMHIIICGFNLIPLLQYLLLQMYGHCAVAEDAFQFFLSMLHKDVVSWNIIIEALTVTGQMQEARCLYHKMQEEGVIPNRTTCMLLLPALSGHESMVEGKQIHVFGMEIGCESDIAVGTALVNMYGKCGSLAESKATFNAMPVRNVVTWTTMISVCVQHHEDMEAFCLFKQMVQEKISPDRVTFVNVLAACSGHSMLTEGQELHALIVCHGFEQRNSIANALIHLYGKCKMLGEAIKVFESVHEKDTISFSSLSLAYAGHGKFKEASSLFEEMELANLTPNKVTLLGVLSVLDCQEAVPVGEDIHNRIIHKGLDEDVLLGNSLINMYQKCGCAESARRTFANMSHRNVVSWTSIIGLHVQHGHCKEAFLAFDSMQEEGLTPNRVTFVSMLDLCANQMAHVDGRILHACTVQYGIESDCIVGTVLIKLYASCNSIEDAQDAFKRIVDPVVLTWNTIVSVYSVNGFGKRLLHLFDRMLSEGILPDNATYGHLLVACSMEGALSFGKQVHARTQGNSEDMNVVTATNIVSMYGKCGTPFLSQRSFDVMSVRNIISWTAMISLYTENGLEDKALQVYAQMLQESVLPNMVTMISVVMLCATQMALAEGKRVHAAVIHSGFGSETALGNALISMYGKCNSLKHAQQTFDSLPEKNVVSWSGLIAVYSQHSNGMTALRLFEEMQLAGVTPNEITLVSVLDACANETCLALGECLHNFLIDTMYELSILVGNSVINMYNKCGDAQGAEKTFAIMTERDMTTWSIMMGTHAEHGHGEEAVQLMEQMMQEGLPPDEASITNLLSACSHCGLLDDGCHWFTSIIQDLCATPDHCACIIDLFSRAGQLEIAEVLVDHIAMQPTLMWYMALLSACRYQGDVCRGGLLAQHVLELDATSTAPFYMLNYISSGASVLDKGCECRINDVL